MSRPTAQQATPQEQQLLTDILSFRDDPLGYVMYAFPWGVEGTPLAKIKKPRTWQIEEFNKIRDHLAEDKIRQALGLGPTPLYLAVSSGRGPGKSAFLAMLDMWVMSCWLGSTTIVTANTETQLRSRTMAELGKWHTMAINSHWFDKSSMSLRPARWFADLVEKQLKIDTQYYYVDAQSWSEENPDAFAGAHSQIGMMVQFDEACHDDKTDVMTDKGWKLFKDVVDGDKLLTMDPTTHVARYARPTKLYAAHRVGKMYEYRAAKTGDFCVTPNHEMYFRTYISGAVQPYGKQQIQHMNRSYHHIPRQIDWCAPDTKEILIPGFVADRSAHHIQPLDADTLAAFMGWYCSEGHLIKRSFKSGIAYLGIGLSQLPGENLDEMKAICDRLGFKYRVSVHPTRKCHQIEITNRGLAEYLATFGTLCTNKCVPSVIRFLSRRQINIFLDAFVKGDGYSRTGRDILYTSSAKLADDLQELCLKAGFASTVTKRPLKDKPIDFGTHTAVSGTDGYVVTRSTTVNDLKFKWSNVHEIDYDGMVYCAEVPPDHLLYTRRNGHAMWSGNSGIPDPIWNVTEGFFTDMSPLRLWLAISNPRRNTGKFFECFHKNRGFWKTRYIDSRTVEGVDRGVYDRIAEQHGEDHDVTRVEVKGEFPRVGSNQFISREVVDKAAKRDVIDDPGSPLLMGVDVARFGDDESVIRFRRGRDARTMKPVRFRGADTMELASSVAALIEKHHPDAVFVDGGGVGGGVVDRLKQLGYRVIEVQSGEKARDDDKYLNRRAEMWGEMRDWLVYGCIEDESDLHDDLTGPEYGVALKGQIKLESKDSMKKRGLASPDDADALALTFAEPVSRRDASTSRTSRGRERVAVSDYDVFASG